MLCCCFPITKNRFAVPVSGIVKQPAIPETKAKEERWDPIEADDKHNAKRAARNAVTLSGSVQEQEHNGL